MRISDWPLDCRPRERVLAGGAQQLSDAELLAVFLRTGVSGKSAVDLSHELLQRFGNLRRLSQATLDEFSSAPGLGPAKFALLQAALELGLRVQREALQETDMLSSPRAVRDFLQARLGRETRECFTLLLLDVRNQLLALDEVSRGTLDRTAVYAREVVRSALLHNASSVILAHNHPSGDPTPSEADQSTTQTLRQALALIDVRVLDHIIVAGNRTYSLAENGKM